jgi:uncharacterized protein YgbK (DUF1537 family)
LSVRLLVLADDLTGAADCGVQALRSGLRAAVVLAPPGGAGAPEVEVLAVDLDTRAGDEARARERTAHAAGHPAARGVPVYLKIDSLLRGHVGAALDAALAATGADLAVVAPPFPG